jgi:tripartite-type tricarboxylate transporter receptor subunit TctC
VNLNLIQIASLANKATDWLRRRHFATLGAMVLIASVTAVMPVAQAAWPERAITMIVPFPPGGPADSLARAIALKLQERLGQPVVIDNKPGAGGMLGVELGARAKPDGYTMIMAGSSIVLVSAIDPKAMRIDVRKDLQPITIISKLPLLLSANPSAPFSTFKEFVAYAKANPGRVSVGVSPGLSTTAHVLIERIKFELGIDVVPIPYKGSAPALMALVSGEVPAILDYLPTAGPFITSGKIKPITLMSDTRNSSFSQIPSIVELGYPAYSINAWNSLMLPAGTPKEIVARLNREVVDIIKSPEMKTKFFDLGQESGGNTPEQFAEIIRSSEEMWIKVIRDAKLTFPK